MYVCTFTCILCNYRIISILFVLIADMCYDMYNRNKNVSVRDMKT